MLPISKSEPIYFISVRDVYVPIAVSNANIHKYNSRAINFMEIKGYVESIFKSIFVKIGPYLRAVV